MTERTEKVYVLYGSQTGNSEQAAKDLCDQVKTKLSPSEIKKWGSTKDEVTVIPVTMQLDDFLELERAQWTRLIVIITSSYGVGQAPLGCYRFRELCDAWASEKNSKLLDGLQFALCGLGDSKFTTYFENPTKINESLHLVGAKRVGPLGKADASGRDEHAQNLVIERWIEGIWPFLAKVVAQEQIPANRLEEMQKVTVELCQKINPDFLPERELQQLPFLGPLIVALLAIAMGYYVYYVLKN
jgi:sulfite reductase alpha subunit-like flavoprotein